MPNPKFIFISGGVISGIGKGLTSASISLLLKSSGCKVAPIKFENYLNVDAGTINPIEHGDTFLCEDGTEADMDIGTYEKFLSEDMSIDNFVTMGKIYKTVIDRERRFEYNGEDVEAIPHITDEITSRIMNIAVKKKADIVVIELGGTVGEYQNALYYEAARIMTLKHPQDVIHVHVSYVITPEHLGEPKTKPVQLSVKTLNSMGIQPNILIARSHDPLDQRRIDRLANFCNLKPENIISNPDCESIYDVPIIMEAQGLTKKILSELSLSEERPNLKHWQSIKTLQNKQMHEIEIAIVGKYFGTGDYKLHDAYAALFDAIDHAALHTGIKPKINVISAEEVESKGTDIIGKPKALIVPIGWGVRGSEGKIIAASYARKNQIPFLGLCYGMQLAVVAFARDLLGWSDANSTENDPDTAHPVIHLIAAQAELMQKRAYGGTMRLGGYKAIVKPGTHAHALYKRFGSYENIEKDGSLLTSERHRHRYEFNNQYAQELERAGLVIAARSQAEGLVEIIELSQDKHPFYVATQGHPEYKSTPLSPHPLFIGIMEQAKNS